MAAMQAPLDLEDLVLRPFDDADAAPFVAAARESVATIGRWMSWCHADFSEQDALNWFAACRAGLIAGTAHEFVVFDARTGELLGAGGLNAISAQHRFCNLGYWVRQSAQRRGIAPRDAADCIAIRGRTRQNAIPAARLAELGIDERSWAASIASIAVVGHAACVDGALVGYCFGDTVSGEIVVLALPPEHEGRGLGRELLRRTMADLRARGHARLFLGCSDNSAARSYGFYRRLGWRSTGARDSFGDEVLEHLVASAETPR